MKWIQVKIVIETRVIKENVLAIIRIQTEWESHLFNYITSYVKEVIFHTFRKVNLINSINYYK